MRPTSITKIRWTGGIFLAKCSTHESKHANYAVCGKPSYIQNMRKKGKTNASAKQRISHSGLKKSFWTRFNFVVWNMHAKSCFCLFKFTTTLSGYILYWFFSCRSVKRQSELFRKPVWQMANAKFYQLFSPKLRGKHFLLYLL